jgi:hypothetical protein
VGQQGLAQAMAKVMGLAQAQDWATESVPAQGQGLALGLVPGQEAAHRHRHHRPGP